LFFVLFPFALLLLILLFDTGEADDFFLRGQAGKSLPWAKSKGSCNDRFRHLACQFAGNVRLCGLIPAYLRCVSTALPPKPPFAKGGQGGFLASNPHYGSIAVIPARMPESCDRGR